MASEKNQSTNHSHKMFQKKAQAWGIDLIVATMIFFGGIVFFYLFLLNDSGSDESSNLDLKKEAEIFSGSVFSEGSPENWTAINVVRIGILTDGEVDFSKLEQFHDLSVSDYQLTKSLLRIKNEYYLNFSQPINFGEGAVAGIGSPPIDARNLFKLARLNVINGEIKNFNVYIWN